MQWLCLFLSDRSLGNVAVIFDNVIFKPIWWVNILSTCEIALRWMTLNTFDDKSRLVQVMACCRQAPSHYLSQWWPRSMSLNKCNPIQTVSPYGITIGHKEFKFGISVHWLMTIIQQQWLIQELLSKENAETHFNWRTPYVGKFSHEIGYEIYHTYVELLRL